jgi:excisionase family DNA binding protein
MSTPQNQVQAVQQLLTTQQAAAALGLSTDNLIRRAHCGELPVVKLPGARSWRFHRKDIDAYIERAKIVL